MKADSSRMPGSSNPSSSSLLLSSSSGFDVAERDELWLSGSLRAQSQRGSDKLISGPTNFPIIGAQLSQCDCEH